MSAQTWRLILLHFYNLYPIGNVYTCCIDVDEIIIELKRPIYFTQQKLASSVKPYWRKMAKISALTLNMHLYTG